MKGFLQVVPHLESLIQENGITLLKYFLDVSEAEQEKRFRQRINDPLRQGKLSPMDVESSQRWWDYSKAYGEMITATDSAHAPWWIAPTDEKERAWINCISRLLSQVPYEWIKFEKQELGKRQKRPDDFIPDSTQRRIVPAAG